MAQGAKQPTPTISTHVLDTERGMPAAGVQVTLYRLADDGRPIRMTQALTDDDGRVRDLLERPLTAGDYRLEFGFERGRLLRAAEHGPARQRRHPELPRAAAAGAVLADDVPRQLSRGAGRGQASTGVTR